MHGIYSYIPEKTQSLRYTALQLYCIYVTRNVVSAVKYVLHVYSSTFRSLCGVPNMAGFCNSSVSCFPAMLLR